MIGIVVSRRCYAIERLWIEMFRGGFGATAAVDGGGDDASGISRPFRRMGRGRGGQCG